MKVLMFNGSPKAKGCTYTALEEMAKVLNEEGIETEIMHVGAHPQGSCMGCGGCSKTGECVYGGEVVEAAKKLKEADGVVFGSPVHYASISGNMMGFLHRLSWSAGKDLKYKPAAADYWVYYKKLPQVQYIYHPAILEAMQVPASSLQSHCLPRYK